MFRKPSLTRAGGELFTHLSKRHVVNLDITEEDYPFSYANVVNHIGRDKITNNYQITCMEGNYLQFNYLNPKKIIATQIVSPRIKNEFDVFNKPNNETTEKQEPKLQISQSEFEKRKLRSTKNPQPTNQGGADLGALVTCGWKFHISVAPDDIKVAWRIASQILMKYRVSGFKMIHPDFLQSKMDTKELDKLQDKQITIYAFKNQSVSVQKWTTILNEIEAAFIKKGIKPKISNTPPTADKMVNHSNYLSYRNDTGISGKQIDGDAAVAYAKANNKDAYNLLNKEDRFQDISINEKATALPSPKA